MTHHLVQLTYLVATVLFVFSLQGMNDPKTARRGVQAGIVAMFLAIAATWAQPGITHHIWILVAIVAGIAVGVPLSKVPLTAVPQRTAISHAFGGLAAGLVGTAKFILWSVYEPQELSQFRMAAIVQGIAMRARQGNASSENAAAVGQMAGAIADAAWGLVERSR